jgi:hypothetical protein
MTQRELAILLLRCSGVISVVSSFFHALGYLPGIFGAATLASSAGMTFVVGPVLGGLLGGGALVLLSRPLGTAIARGLSNSSAPRQPLP